MTTRSREAALLQWTCLLLFAARVLGQFEAFTLGPDWLPDMNAWYSGLLSYPLLLPAQVVLLMVMSVVAWNRRVRTGRFAAARPRVATTLRAFAVLYFAVMAVRLAVNVNAHGGDFWRHGAIPVAFHWILALFLLVSARKAPPQELAQEAEDAPHGDVPALAAAVLRIPDCQPNYPR